MQSLTPLGNNIYMVRYLFVVMVENEPEYEIAEEVAPVKKENKAKKSCSCSENIGRDIYCGSHGDRDKI